MSREEREQRVARLLQGFGVELMTFLRHMADAAGVGQTDMLALGVLAARGPLGVNELGRRLELSSASVTGLVDRLEAAGHVRRVRDTHDRRRVVVETTDLAERTARRVLAGYVAEVGAVLRGCTLAELEAAEKVLGAALGALERSRTGAPSAAADHDPPG